MLSGKAPKPAVKKAARRRHPPRRLRRRRLRPRRRPSRRRRREEGTGAQAPPSGAEQPHLRTFSLARAECPGPLARTLPRRAATVVAVELFRIRLPLDAAVPHRAEHDDAQGRAARPRRDRRRRRLGRGRRRDLTDVRTRDARLRPARAARRARAAAVRRRSDSTPCAATTRRGPRCRARCSTPGSAPRGRRSRRIWAAPGPTSTPASRSAGSTTWPSCVADASARTSASGYRSVKLKIAPGHDVDVVAAVRAEVGPDVALAGRRERELHPRRRRPPGRARRARRRVPRAAARTRRARSTTRGSRNVCARRSASTRRSPARGSRATRSSCGACSIVSIKSGLVGGLDEARRVHDVCVEAGVAARAGGMLETGVGRAALHRARRRSRLHRDR